MNDPYKPPLSVPVSFKVDVKTSKMLRDEAGSLPTGQFVRMVLEEGLRIRVNARASRLKAHIGVRSKRG
jgi:SNF2 family DNA or RNA helicase